MVDGRRYTRNTGLAATERNISAAMKIMERDRLAIENGEPSRLVQRPFSDSVSSFLHWAEGEYPKASTVRRLATSFTSQRLFWGNTLIASINAGSIENYKTWRRSMGIKEVTLRHDLHAASLLWQYAIKQGWAKESPVSAVEIPSDKDAVRIHVLTDREEAVYFAAAARFPNLHDVGRLMLLQGLRPSEVFSLRPADVNLEARTLTVRDGKSAAARRTLRLLPESLAILRPRMAGGRFCFMGRSGKLTKLQSAHLRVLKATGLRFVLYDLRHTFATRMAERGMAPATLAAILGHGDLRSVAKYVHVRPEAQFEAMERFGERGQIGTTPTGIEQVSASLTGNRREAVGARRKSME
jgi:integrase